MNEHLPAAIDKLIQNDTLKIWRRPNIFTLAGVEKARIIWKHDYGSMPRLVCRDVDKITDAATRQHFSDFVHRLGRDLDAAIYGI